MDTEVPTGPTWERLESQISWYDKNAQSNQRWFKYLKVAQIAIAAGIPVIAAAGVDVAVAGAMGAFVVVCEGVQQLFQFQSNWTAYRATCEALKREQYLFLAGAADYEDPRTRMRTLAVRVETLVSDETASWTAAQRDADARGDQGE